jgi:hypothetical protein
MNYLIEYNNKIIGVYNTFEDAELYILGNIQNNLFNNNVKILTFKSNSCYCTEIKNYYDYENSNNNNDNYNNDNDNDIEEKNIIKAELRHEINMINCKKKKIEEKKKIYENDLKLFQLFKNKDINDIPQLFKNKYKIINNLNDINNLNIDSYFDELNKINNIIYDEFEIDNINNV